MRPAAAPAALPEAESAPAPDWLAADGDGPRAENETLEPFDLGPSFAEQRELEEDKKAQEEKGLLRTIFEQNVALQASLAGVEEVAA